MTRIASISQAAWLWCYVFCLSLAACLGCGKAELPEAALNETDDVHGAALIHSPSSRIEQVLQKANQVLTEIYAEKVPDRFPNWIAFHALLMYGDSAYEDHISKRYIDDNLQRIFSVILNSTTSQNGPYVMRNGFPYPRHDGPYFCQEHHPNQFLTYFSMSGGKLDARITIDGVKHTSRNLLDRSLLEANPTGELAYTVLCYSHYLEPKRRWTNKFGKSMSLAILLEKLLATQEKTCLATHRLAALARTHSRQELRADPEVERLWPELERQVYEALLDLKQRQRPDGGFLLPGMTPGTPLRDHQDIYYVGHSLEWITFLGDEYIQDDWVVRALERLTQAIGATYLGTYYNMDAIGTGSSHVDFDGLSHGVSAIRRWRDKVQNKARSLRAVEKKGGYRQYGGIATAMNSCRCRSILSHTSVQEESIFSKGDTR